MFMDFSSLNEESQNYSCYKEGDNVCIRECKKIYLNLSRIHAGSGKLSISVLPINIPFAQ